jgi:hypothetical protein
MYPCLPQAWCDGHTKPQACLKGCQLLLTIRRPFLPQACSNPHNFCSEQSLLLLLQVLEKLDKEGCACVASLHSRLQRRALWHDLTPPPSLLLLLLLLQVLEKLDEEGCARVVLLQYLCLLSHQASSGYHPMSRTSNFCSAAAAGA